MNWFDLYICVLAVLATEAIAEIVAKSKFFDPVHRKLRLVAYPPDATPPDTFIRKAAAGLDALTSCGYCTSVWVSLLLTSWYLPGSWWLFPLKVFGLHRASNWAHTAFTLLLRGRVATYDITSRTEVNLPSSAENIENHERV